MCRLELLDSFINVYKDKKDIYSFNWETLKEVWDYATLDDVEGINAEYSDGLLSVILTTAEGQGGIVAVIDTVNDELIHYHEGSFAIKTLLAGDRIITLYHVMCYGSTPTYFVDCMYLDNMGMNEADDNVKLPEDIDFNDEKITLTLIDENLTIEDENNCFDINISPLM